MRMTPSNKNFKRHMPCSKRMHECNPLMNQSEIKSHLPYLFSIFLFCFTTVSIRL